VKYICADCGFKFDEPGRTYDELDRFCSSVIGACPQCLSDDYTEIDEVTLLHLAKARITRLSEQN
jgi:hypothetical protein